MSNYPDQKQQTVNMNTKLFIPLLLLTISLKSAEHRRPATGAGTVQRMGDYTNAQRRIINHVSLGVVASYLVLVAGTPCCPAAGLTACQSACFWVIGGGGAG